jgi:hypothetical protein
MEKCVLLRPTQVPFWLCFSKCIGGSARVSVTIGTWVLDFTNSDIENQLFSHRVFGKNSALVKQMLNPRGESTYRKNTASDASCSGSKVRARIVSAEPNGGLKNPVP